MKQTKTKLLCLILTALMLLSGLTACGKDKEGKDSNLIKLGDYELLYKGACIMEDSDGNDAIVLTLDFTNNSKENASYLWSVDETVMQNGVELEPASIITDYENLETVVSDQFTDVAPGATLEVRTAFVLKDTTSEVKATFEEFLGSKKGTITVDPATLSRETVSHTEPETSNTTGDTLLDWWNGEWYGWWKMSGCYGDYESMEGDWWDVCGVIDLDTDYTGTIELWDEDYTRSKPMASAQVSLSEAGTGEHGTVMSEGGWFTNVTLEHADWIVDPGLLDYDDMIWISGDYEDGDAKHDKPGLIAARNERFEHRLIRHAHGVCRVYAREIGLLKFICAHLIGNLRAVQHAHGVRLFYAGAHASPSSFKIMSAACFAHLR